MSDTKFTKGPWRVMDRGRDGCTVYATDDELRYIAFCKDLPNHIEHPRTNDAANASLIAAAPEMYEELEKAAEFLEELDNSEITRSDVSKTTVERVRRILNLLAKARGES